LATNPKQELIRLSSKERLDEIPASRRESVICAIFITEYYSRSKKNVAWLAIRFPAKFCDAYSKPLTI
jgi:hypothetical protein